MYYKTKEGVEVFNIKHKGEIYQLTNEFPAVGDYCLVALEHDPVHVVRVKSFNENEYYQLNKDYRYGTMVWNVDTGIRFYGVAKIHWTTDKSLEIKYQDSRHEMLAFWKKNDPTLTLNDF